MKVDEGILIRLDQLIEMGEQVLKTKQEPGPMIVTDSYVDEQLAAQWKTNAQNLLDRVFGPQSAHYKNFSELLKSHISYTPAFRAQGVLRPARDDYANEHLFEVRRLIEAELFDDFLEQSEHLLTAGYNGPAAVVAGCVLEDGLRKLCQNHGIALPEPPKLDRMNAELAKKGAYTKLVQKRVTALADVRTKAAHGRWDEFTASDVHDMIRDLRRFIEEQLA